MRDPNGSKAGLFARAFPEKTILLRSNARLHCLRLCSKAQIAGIVGLTVAGLWTAGATGLLAVKLYGEAERDAAEVEVAAAYEARLAQAVGRIAALETAAKAEAARAETAAAALAERHEAFAEALTAEQEAAAEAAALRLRAEALSRERDALEARLAALEAEDGDMTRRLAEAEGERDELALTLERVAVALDAAAHARDDAKALAGEIGTALGALEAGVAAERDSQAVLLAQLEEAAELSLGPLEDMLRTAGVDLDGILAEMRREAQGEGGPFVPVPETTAALAAMGEARVLSVMTTLERASLLRLAAARLPFQRPVAGARMSSRFGGRKDPINGRRAVHEGLDFAGPRGTPIIATAEGEVTFAGWMSGYGRVVKIRHDFGFETLYAHMDRTRVDVGQRVEPGDRVGDLGNTGRSTGPHLHYEIRVGGRPVDPQKFIKAATNVL